MVLLDLAELSGEKDLPWPLTHNRLGLLSLHDRQFITKSAAPILQKIGRVFRSSSPRSDDISRVFLLTTPGLLGYSFNPATFYFIIGHEGSLIGTVVEVHNAFGEAHLYSLTHDGSTTQSMIQKANKEFHVSPFLDRSGHYEFDFTLNEENVRLSVTLHQDGMEILRTSFDAALLALNRNNLLRMLPRIATSVLLTEIRILWQTHKLFRKPEIPFYRKPDPPANSSDSPAKGFISRSKLPFM